MEDNFLTQLVSELTRGGASLDLLFTNREGLSPYNEFESLCFQSQVYA